jgi:hypothetical protein
MKEKRIYLVLGLALLFLLATTAVVSAQNGSIRGTVYVDSNADGLCGPTYGDPVQVGVPIEFVSNDGGFTTFLQSGENGTYGLVAAGYGTWQVSARPNANDFVVTGTATRSVFIGSEEPVALDVDFCVVATSGGTIPGGGSGLGVIVPITQLPAAGASDNLAGFGIALLFGVALLGAGGYLLIRAKRSA